MGPSSLCTNDANAQVTRRTHLEPPDMVRDEVPAARNVSGAPGIFDQVRLDDIASRSGREEDDCHGSPVSDALPSARLDPLQSPPSSFPVPVSSPYPNSHPVLVPVPSQPSSSPLPPLQSPCHCPCSCPPSPPQSRPHPAHPPPPALVTHLDLHSGHWTNTIPFSYDRFANSWVDRWPQSLAVHVNVRDLRGVSGYVEWVYCGIVMGRRTMIGSYK